MNESGDQRPPEGPGEPKRPEQPDGPSPEGPPPYSSQEPPPTPGGVPPAPSASAAGAPPPPSGGPPARGSEFSPSAGRPGAGPAPGEAYTVGEAFNYGWAKFQQNVGVVVLGVLAYMVAIGLLTLIWFFLVGFITAALSSPGGDAGAAGGFFGFLFTVSIGVLVAYVGFFIVQAGITRAALAITYGEPVEIKTLFAFDGIAQLLLGSVVLGVAASVGFLLCGLPGIILLFFSQFFVHFLLDKRMSAFDAIKASFGFVNQHLATLIGFYIASAIAYFLGGLLCGVGILVALPVVVIGQAYTYRRLRGEPVAA